MSESTFSNEPRGNGSDEQSHDPPQFGAVDIVEAFTAMRHECRSQIKESRSLAEEIRTAVIALQSLESKLAERTAETLAADQDPTTRQLVLLIAETDHQLTRAADAFGQWEKVRTNREQADADAIAHCVARMGPVSRWFARPLLNLLADRSSLKDVKSGHNTVEGVSLVLARLRRGMKEHQIERIDVEGRIFDENIMNAIGTVVSPDCPPGHVAEQLSPVYRWRDRLLRFADVRVAKEQ